MSSPTCNSGRTTGEHRTIEKEHFIGHTILFIAAVLLAIVMLSAALIIVLSDVVGSLLLALIIIGVVSFIIAYLIYWLSLRPRLKEAERDFNMIVDIIHLLRFGYGYATSLLKILIK